MRRALLTLALCLLGRASLAQDASGEARRHFEVGLALVDRHAWDSALVEFLRSAELQPTANALKNAAVCRRELGRFDEAIDTYNELVAKFRDELTQEQRRAIDADVARIEPFTGLMMVKSGLPGATIVVDDRVRGITPIERPMRLTVGTRAVRVEHTGRAPYETKVLVTHGDVQTVEAILPIISRVGTLRVDADRKEPYEVLIDGAVVGQTPWTGTLATATHTVALHNTRGDLGSEPRTIEVQTDQTSELTIPVHRLSGLLRVEPTPNQASVFIDGQPVAQGSWGGLVLVGKHVVHVESPWFESETETVRVTNMGIQAVRPILSPIPRAYIDVSAGVVPLLDPGVRGGIGACNSVCVGYTVGLRAGYIIKPRLSIELGLGLWSLPYEATTTISGVFEGANVQAPYGEVADTMLYTFGPSLRYQIGDRWPLTLRLFAGAANGTTDNTTGGRFVAPDGYSYAIGNRSSATTFWTPAIQPEIRFGRRFARAIVVDVGTSVLLYVTPSVPAEQSTNLNVLQIPARPSLDGGVRYAIPFNVAIRVEL